MATIVITGGTSGIGKLAASDLRERGFDVILGARNPVGDQLPIELASLASVRSFADRIDAPIGALVLNAGMQAYGVDTRTVDGFETVFAVNHLAHYLLARLLLPRLSDGGRLIITSSGTHDPAEKTGVPPPRHADAAMLADPSTDPDRDARGFVAGTRAYAASKLCNLMTARTLAARAEVRSRGIVVHAYDPGFIPATGLGRSAPWPIRAIVLPLLGRFPLGAGMNTLAAGATGLAGLADGSIDNDAVYMSLRKARPTWPEPSAIARNDAACERLWADSAAMVGLPA